MKKFLFSIVLLSGFSAYAEDDKCAVEESVLAVEEVAKEAVEAEMSTKSMSLRDIWLQQTPDLNAWYMASSDEVRADFDQFCKKIACMSQNTASSVNSIQKEHAEMLAAMKECVGAFIFNMTLGLQKSEAA